MPAATLAKESNVHALPGSTISKTDIIHFFCGGEAEFLHGL